MWRGLSSSNRNGKQKILKTVVHFVTSLNDCDVPNFHIRVLACENIRFSSLFFDEDVSRNVLGGEQRGETDVFAG